MADPVAVMRAASNTTKMANTVKGMWEERLKLRADSEGQAWELVLAAQIDEVYLVLAHLGEALLPLGVFDKDYYLQTLGDVKSSLASCGNDSLQLAFEQLDSELQYCCCAGLVFCAHFAPLPVYRGFGACILSDYDWACPNYAYLEEKARKKAIRTVYGVKQKTDPQPTRSVFQDFDQAIQVLQVKPMAFFVKRPASSAFTEQVRFSARPKKEIKHDLDLLEDWFHSLERKGHPAPPGQKITNWGVPYATYTSDFNCSILRTEKDCETLLVNQMDPGRLLHAFVCRGTANLDEHSILLLMPRTPAESLVCWLEGLPGITLKIIKWEDLESEQFEKKLSKSLRKKVGQYPIPLKYAIRDPNARPALQTATSSPAVLEHPNTVNPPPYSPSNASRAMTLPAAELPDSADSMPVAELAGPEMHELAGSNTISPAQAPAQTPTQTPTNTTEGRGSQLGLKSINDLRRIPSDHTAGAKQTLVVASLRHPTILRPGAPRSRASSSRMIESGSSTEGTKAVELPAELASPPVIQRKPVPSVIAQPQPVTAEVLAVSSDNGGMIPDSERPTPSTKESTHSTNSSGATEGPTSSAVVGGADSNQYLELLNKVARGEISPAALGAMLQGGIAGSTNPSLPVQFPATPPIEPAEEMTSLATKTPIALPERTILPYPVSPTEGR